MILSANCRSWRRKQSRKGNHLCRCWKKWEKDKALNTFFFFRYLYKQKSIDSERVHMKQKRGLFVVLLGLILLLFSFAFLAQEDTNQKNAVSGNAITGNA